MSQSATATKAAETIKAAPMPQPPVPDVQQTPEPEVEQGATFVQRAVNAAGGASPQTPPRQFGSVLGQMGSGTVGQRGVLQRLQQGYGNQYVGQVIQAKLTIGQPGDVYEEEAELVADTVMRMSESDVSSKVSVSNRIQPLRIQRMCAECREEEEERIHLKESPGQTPIVTPGLETQLNTSKSSGQPLPGRTRALMESRFGQDFSQVRVHLGGEAAQMNRELQAQAFTRQRDIYFGSGKYNPDSSEGQRLLAHELTHVLQQTSHQANRVPVNLIQRDDGEEQGNPEPQVGERVGNWEIQEVRRDWRDVVTLRIVNTETGQELYEQPWQWRHRRARAPLVEGNIAIARLGEDVARGVATIIEWGFPVSAIIAQGITQYLYSVGEEEAPEAEARAEGPEIPETTPETEPSGSVERTEETPTEDVILTLPSATLFQGKREEKDIFSASTGNITFLVIPLELWGIPLNLSLGGEAHAQAQASIGYGRGILRNLRFRLSRAQAFVLQSALALSGRRLEYLIPLLPLLGEFEASAQFSVPAHIGANLSGEGSLNAAIRAVLIEIVRVEAVLWARGEAGVDELYEAPVQLRSRDRHLTFSVDQYLEINPHLAFSLGPSYRVQFLRSLLGSRARFERSWEFARWEWSQPLTLGTRFDMDYDNGLEELNYLDFEEKFDKVRRVVQLYEQLLNAGPPLMYLQEEGGCNVYPLGYHRGFDDIHNTCADFFNIHPGSDIEVEHPNLGRKSFDALDSNNNLWEIKTELYSTYAPFIKQRTLDQCLNDIRVESPLALACGYGYIFGVADQDQYNDLLPLIPAGVNLQKVDCL